jgi:hypothetical protein
VKWWWWLAAFNNFQFSTEVHCIQFQPANRSSTTHSQMLQVIDTSTAVSSVMLRTGYCYVCADMALFQQYLLYKPYVKCGSATKCQRKFHCKFPGNTVSSTGGIHKLIKKFRSLGHFWTRNMLQNAVRLLTKYRIKKASFKHTPQKSVRCPAQETGISKPSAATAMSLLKLRLYKATCSSCFATTWPG